MEKTRDHLSMRLRAVLLGVALSLSSMVTFAGSLGEPETFNPDNPNWACYCTLMGDCRATSGGNICASNDHDPPACSDYTGNC